MTGLEAIILGIIQGLTEFLPVSSSGHLILAKELFGIQHGENIAFEIVVHAATVLSTITVFRKEIGGLIQQFFKFKWNTETQYITKIFLSMVPMLILGLFFKDSVEHFFGQGVLLVGIMLLITAILLLLAQFVKFKEERDVNYKSAFVIGLAQAVAVLPGLSRSGSTIATGLLFGVKKEEIAKFSFLMVLIPILGEAFLDLIAGEFSATASGIAPISLTLGFISAYLVGVFACKWMIHLVKKAKLYWFALYCGIIGLITIFTTLFQY